KASLAQVVTPQSNMEMFAIAVDSLETLVINEVKALPMQIEKKARFVELDFNEPAITNKPPTEAVMASQRFRFKIGVAGQSTVGIPSKEYILGLKKQFN